MCCAGFTEPLGGCICPTGSDPLRQVHKSTCGFYTACLHKDVIVFSFLSEDICRVAVCHRELHLLNEKEELSLPEC